jgi:hypothetical protein
MGSNPGCIKENIIKLVAATPVTKQHQGVRTKTTIATNFIIFSLMQPGLEPMFYHTA